MYHSGHNLEFFRGIFPICFKNTLFWHHETLRSDAMKLLRYPKTWKETALCRRRIRPAGVAPDGEDTSSVAGHSEYGPIREKHVHWDDAWRLTK